jgi:predicted transcriptional regulator
MHRIHSQDYAVKVKDLEAKVDQWKQEELKEVKDQVEKLVKKLEERDRAARELI